MRGTHKFILNSPEWGEIRIVRAIPSKEDIWGVLAPLRDTPWGKQIAVVTGEAFSHATHGHATPLMQQIGPAPTILIRLIPDPYRICDSLRGCLTAKYDVCFPGAKMPDCYVPPKLEADQRDAAALLARSWRDGYYVIVVDGDEFSL